MSRFRWVVLGWALSVFFFSVSAGSGELPDFEVNPITGHIESVDAPAENDFMVRHVEDAGQGASGTSTTISVGTAISPRLAIDAAGSTWVVWWSDSGTDRVEARVFDRETETWGSQRNVGNSDEQSSYPEIVHDSEGAWIVYQIETADGTDLAALSIIDSGDPWPSRTIAASSEASGDLDLRVRAKGGHLWITWIDDEQYVGWTEYDYGSDTWGATQYESYSGSDAETARKEIFDQVQGL